MRILHTSDWHLGKTLEGYSRLVEQEEFIEELAEIVERENVDMILLAGDVYDTSNPPAAAEQLFYRSMKKLSKDGERPIVVIAGNHDNPERLTAASPLAYKQGVILLGTPKSIAQTGKYKGFEIIESGEGYIKLSIQEREVVLLTLPYPSEKRLNEVISEDADEEEMQMSYSQHIGTLFRKLSGHYRENTINLAMSHLFMTEGQESDSERQIQLGGSLAVDTKCLPPAQYIALGHLHRPQRVAGDKNNAYYSGSPIQYSKSELHYSKCVYLVDVEPGQEPLVQSVYLRNYKPIEVWKCFGMDEALERCRKEYQKSAWVYLEIETDRVLTADEIKALRDLRKDIVEIRPILTTEEEEEQESKNLTDLNIMELFQEFYFQRRGVKPSEEVVELFAQIIGEEEEQDEAVSAET